MNLKLKITSLFLFFLSIASAQNAKEIEDNHDHHSNEIGVSTAPIYMIDEKSLSYGFHIHYIRNITHTKFGVGVGYEKIFDEHQHNTFGIIAAYRPIERLTLGLSPGLIFEKGAAKGEFALHCEILYEFEYKNFHFGPTIEYSIHSEGNHVSAGIHLGYGF